MAKSKRFLEALTVSAMLVAESAELARQAEQQRPPGAIQQLDKVSRQNLPAVRGSRAVLPRVWAELQKAAVDDHLAYWDTIGKYCRATNPCLALNASYRGGAGQR